MSDQEAKEKGLASKYFDALNACQDAENRIDWAIEAIFGLEPDSIYKDPFERITKDWYDCSFELKEATPGWSPTEAQIRDLWDLGFLQGWICRRDGKERWIQCSGRFMQKSGVMSAFSALPLNSKYRPIFTSARDGKHYVKVHDEWAMLHYGEGQDRDDTQIRFDADHPIIANPDIFKAENLE